MISPAFLNICSLISPVASIWSIVSGLAQSTVLSPSLRQDNNVYKSSPGLLIIFCNRRINSTFPCLIKVSTFSFVNVSPPMFHNTFCSNTARSYKLFSAASLPMFIWFSISRNCCHDFCHHAIKSPAFNSSSLFKFARIFSTGVFWFLK